MEADPPERRRRLRRYSAIGAVIAVYFGFHTLAQTALAVLSGGGVLTALAIALYMGVGIVLDSPASGLAQRTGLRAVVLSSGAVVILSSLVGAWGEDLGWGVLPLAVVLAVCSSLIYVPALAYYSALLGAQQSHGQRVAVFLQRGGALLASGVIAIALGPAPATFMWWAMIFAGVLLLLLGTRLPGRGPAADRAVRPGIRSVLIALQEVRRSRRLVSGVVTAASMPVVFVLTGSLLLVAIPEHGAAIGVGLLLREAVAVVSVLVLGRGTLARSNREFVAGCTIAILGTLLLLIAPSTLTVVLGMMATGPVLASAIITSAWNTSQASVASTRGWACFGAMGMAARTSGLLSPLALSAALGGGVIPLGVVFALVLGTMGWAVMGADRPGADSSGTDTPVSG